MCHETTEIWKYPRRQFSLHFFSQQALVPRKTEKSQREINGFYVDTVVGLPWHWLRGKDLPAPLVYGRGHYLGTSVCAVQVQANLKQVERVSSRYFLSDPKANNLIHEHVFSAPTSCHTRRAVGTD